jgi:hypothetical protein
LLDVTVKNKIIPGILPFMIREASIHVLWKRDPFVLRDKSLDERGSTHQKIKNYYIFFKIPLK